MSTPMLSKLSAIKDAWVYVILWLLAFVLYFPTAKAGWVIDAAGFLYNLRHQNFWDYINRVGSSDQSFYQVLTLHYYIFYKLWKLNFWLWSLLYITVHALNALLIFIIIRNILTDAGITKNALIALTTVVIYTISPHISEVLIGRAYYHYLQSFFFILMILYSMQKNTSMHNVHYMQWRRCCCLFWRQ